MVNRRGFLGRLLGVGAALLAPLAATKHLPPSLDQKIKWADGQVILKAKKLVTLVKVPNELLCRHELQVTGQLYLKEVSL